MAETAVFGTVKYEIGRAQLLDAPQTLKFPGIPVQFSATPGKTRLPAPQHGQHNREIMAEAGLSAAEIDALIAAGILCNKAG